MTHKKPLIYQINKPDSWFYNDMMTWWQKKKEGKTTFGLLLLANESKAVPCFLWDHGHQVDHQILENPVIYIKMIDFPLSKRD